MLNVKAVIVVGIIASAFIAFCYSRFAITIALGLWTLAGAIGLTFVLGAMTSAYAAWSQHQVTMRRLDLAESVSRPQLKSSDD